MTTPAERTRAVLQAKRFLAWVATNLKDPYWIVPPSASVPRKVRDEANRILRHFPMAVDLLDAPQFDRAVVEEYYGPPPEEKAASQGRLFTEGKP